MAFAIVAHLVPSLREKIDQIDDQLYRVRILTTSLLETHGHQELINVLVAIQAAFMAMDGAAEAAIKDLDAVLQQCEKDGAA